MAASRTVTLTFTDQLTDNITDDTLNSPDLGFVIMELMSSAGLTDFNVAISDIKRNVPQTDGDKEAIADIQDSIAAALAALAAYLPLDHDHDADGNYLI